MLVKTFGSAVYGVEAITISIEVNVMNGREYYIVGLPDSAVKESIQRVESAIKTNGYHMPRTKLVVNMAPADIRKSGSAFDLPIAIGTLGASDQLANVARLAEYVIMGELNLDGSIQPIRGALPIAINTRKEGYKGLILPRQNSREAAMVNNLDVYGVSHISEVIGFFGEDSSLKPVIVNAREQFLNSVGNFDIDFSEVKGQQSVKRAMEIAAAGGHNALLIGPPGSGKTMLAKRLPTILPPLTLSEALETTRIHSVAGLLQDNASLIAIRPFRSPHHTVSHTGLVGGGSVPRPGEISLAHNGVLFLDELPEFRRTALEVMRQPLEDRKVSIARARSSVEFPASFMLIASMNPCPCGFHNHPEKVCTCAPGMVQKYLGKISGPLLDRIDLHVEVTPVPFSELSKTQCDDTSEKIRQRVIVARELQAKRYEKYPGIYSNALINSELIRQHCQLGDKARSLLENAIRLLNLSARAYDRILKVGRTIADLDNSLNVLQQHIAEAIQYRSLDREGWAG